MCQIQLRQKWNDKQRSFEVDDVVLLKRDSEQNEWLIAITEEVMLDYNGVVRSVKLRIGKSNRDDQNQILERPLHKIILLVEKQVLVDSPTKEPDSRWFYHLGGASCRCQKSKKRALKWSAWNIWWRTCFEL